jgi:uncharacterized protein YecE (DUF72 family)
MGEADAQCLSLRRKVPKTVTHTAGSAVSELERFVEESAGLGDKLAIFLLQFPPGKASTAKVPRIYLQHCNSDLPDHQHTLSVG